MNVVPRQILLCSCLAVLATGCTALRPGNAHDDAVAILQLSHGEDRFRLAMHEIAQHQVEHDPELRPFLGAIDNFWQEQVHWPEVRDRIADEYARIYSPADLHALRRTLSGSMGERVIAYNDVMDRQLSQQALGAVESRLPQLEAHLHAMQNALATGQAGELTPEQDFAAVRGRAEAGDAAAQLLLAEKYMAGAGTPRSLQQAMPWLEKSAAQGHAPAQDTLASFYYRGVGVPRDYRRARELFEQAAGHSYLPAINNLAWLLATCPDAALRDGKRAVALITPAMDQSVQMLDTLAAAKAEAGNFVDAVQLQRQSIAGIGNTGDERLPPALDRLQAYAAGKPWRDPAPGDDTAP